MEPKALRGVSSKDMSLLFAGFTSAAQEVIDGWSDDKIKAILSKASGVKPDDIAFADKDGAAKAVLDLLFASINAAWTDHVVEVAADTVEIEGLKEWLEQATAKDLEDVRIKRGVSDTAWSKAKSLAKKRQLIIEQAEAEAKAKGGDDDDKAKGDDGNDDKAVKAPSK